MRNRLASRRRTVVLLAVGLGTTAGACHDGTPLGPLENSLGGQNSDSGGNPGDGDSGGTSGDGDSGGTSGDGDSGGTSGDGDSGGTSGDGDSGATSGDGDSGGSPGGGGMGGMGGETSWGRPILPPPQVFSLGRLPLETRACWVAERGSLTLSDWQQQRSLYESAINEWTEETGLSLLWADSCDPVDASGDYPEELRILLSNGGGIDAIEGCSERTPQETWSIEPALLDRYKKCAWNLSLDSAIPTKSLLLHVAGHALGLVHHHFGSRSDCPVDTPTEHAWSPYLAEIDPDSVMLRGLNNDPVDVGAACHLISEWDDGPLSPGDRLSIQMLYPASSERKLVPVGNALMFDGYWVFPEGQPLWFEYQWLRSGAHSEWFLDPSWETTDSTSGIRFGGTNLEGGFFVAPEHPIDVSLQFTDPFGDAHLGTTQAEVNNTKHAAVVSTIL